MPVSPVPCAPGGGSTPGSCACAPSIASAPLCRADGTIVLVVIRSECVDCGTPAADPAAIGWIDATTGAFTPGALPADAGPCDAGCLDTVCRQLCDDTDGDGQPDATYSELWCIRADGSTELVLTYQDDPSVPYTPTAPVACTYGCPETETVTLCDASGPFLRRYTFLNGTATYEDVALDGQTPHVVTGTVGVCAGNITANPPCADTICVTRCDDTDGDGQPDTTYEELWCVAADGSTSLLLTYSGDPSTPYTPTAPVPCVYGTTGSSDLVLCDDTGPFIRRITVTGGTAFAEDFELDGTTPHATTGTVGVCPTGGSGGTPCAEQTTPTATVGLCLADGTPIAVVLTRDCAGTVTQDGWINLTTGAYSAGAPPAGAQACGDSRAFELAGLLCDVDPATGDVLGLVLVEYEYNADGSLASVRLVDPGTGNTYTLQGELRYCPAGAGQEQPEQDLTVLCDVQPDGTVTAFVRDYRRDAASGQISGHTDYTLDGAPYTPTGTVGQCTEPCRNTTALLLCDLPTDGQPAATVTDTAPAPYYPYPTGAPVAGAQPLWDGGGTLTIPAATAPQPGTTGAVATLAATIQAARPACDSGTAHVTVSVDVTQLGPDTGCAATGYLRLFNGPASPVALAATPNNTPAGWSGTLTAEADVPAADLAAGNIGVLVALDTYDDSPTACPGSPRRTGWDLSQFTAAAVYDQTGCAPQFLRTVTVDCETGAVIATSDSTLDGQPYTPTGEPGQCAAAGGGSCCPEQPCPAQNIVEACRCDDTDGDGLPDVGYVELLAVDCTGALTSLGTYTDGLTGPYTPTAPVDCNALDDAEGAPPAIGAQARRRELATGQTWNADAWPTLQSVTAVAHGGTGTITTADGPSTLHTGEAATWSIARDEDARLTGPLTIAADTGTVTVTYTLGVQL